MGSKSEKINALVKAYKAAETKADRDRVFSELYYLLRPNVWSICRQYFTRLMDADDFEQAAAIQILNALRTYDDYSRPFSAYVCGVVRNACATKLKLATGPTQNGGIAP